MPRKQRFKPSRKPAQPPVQSSQQVDERREVHLDDVETEIPARHSDESVIEGERD